MSRLGKGIGCGYGLLWTALYGLLCIAAAANVDESAMIWMFAGIPVGALLLASVALKVGRGFAAASVVVSLVALSVPISILVRGARDDEAMKQLEERRETARRRADGRRLSELREALARALGGGEWSKVREIAEQLRQLDPQDAVPEGVTETARLEAQEAEEQAREATRREGAASSLTLARELVRDPARCASPVALGAAWSGLRGTRMSDPEWPEVARLLPELERCRERLIRGLVEEVRVARAGERERWAEGLRQRLLRERGAVLVGACTGPDRTELTLTWPLMNEALAEAWSGGKDAGDSALLSEMTALGFAGLTWSDGASGRWSRDLSPEPDDAPIRRRLAELGLDRPLSLELPEATGAAEVEASRP